MTRIEPGKVFECLQKCIIRIAKKQRQFQKLCFKVLSNWHVTGFDSGKVCKSLQDYITRIGKKQEQFNSFKNYILKCYQNEMSLESNRKKMF